MNTTTIISKIWSFCNVLRDDGVCYGDYLEQLTYLLFLHNIGEMDSEPMISSNDSLIADTGVRFDYVLTNPPFGKKSSITITNEEGVQEKEERSYNRKYD